MYNAEEIARYIIYHEEKAGRPTNNLRIPKLLYFIQAQFLVNKNEPCFTDRIEAWDFGPVVPSVHCKLRFYAAGAIPFQGDLDFSISRHDRALIDAVLDCCARYSTTDLLEKTHGQAPWKDAYWRFTIGLDNEIPVESMRKYFCK